MKVVILQPGYLPWLGFCDQMYQSDIFVVYDDVQYDKHGWRNRNRIKTAQGAQWLTVPVLVKGLNKPLIKDVLINNSTDWRRTHLAAITQSYSKAPFFSTFIGVFEEIYSRQWNYLIDIDMAFIYVIMEKLNLKPGVLFSSKLDVSGSETQRLVDICLTLGATDYLTGDAAKEYITESLFQDNKIQLSYHNYQHPVYNQLYGEFIPYLSIIDLIFNHGPVHRDILGNR